MKNSIIAIAIATIVSGAAMAQDFTGANASSVAGAAVGTSSSTLVVGNGYAYDAQVAGAGAWNQSTASVSGDSDVDSVYQWSRCRPQLVGFEAESAVATGAETSGGSYSFVKGVNVDYGHAIADGTAVAGAIQHGEANAVAAEGTWLPDTFAIAGSSAEVGSFSGAINHNNGFASNGTLVSAGNESVAGANHDVNWSEGFSESTGAYAETIGGTSNLSGGVALGAFGITGGTAEQSGFGLGQAGSQIVYDN